MPKKTVGFRLSLRTLFVALTLLCILLGVIVIRATQQRRAVEWVAEQGGRTKYKYDWKALNSRTPQPDPAGPAWLRERVGIDYFESIASVSLTDLRLNDITPLADLRQIKVLWIDGTDVADLRPIAGLTSLERLIAGRTSVVALSPLAELRSLIYLDLNSTNVSDLKPLSKLTKLETLVLRFTEVRDVTPLLKLKNLTYLDINDTLVTEDDHRKLQAALPRCQISWNANRLH